MANYYGTTVSSGGKLKKGSEEKVKEIISRYTFGHGEADGLTVEIDGGVLHVYGYDSMVSYTKDDDPEHDAEVFDDFLNEVSKYLAEPLIVTEVGTEKCRYANAYAYVVKPNKNCVCVSLDEAINKILK